MYYKMFVTKRYKNTDQQRSQITAQTAGCSSGLLSGPSVIFLSSSWFTFSFQVFDKLKDIHNILRRTTSCSSSSLRHPPHPHSDLHHPAQSFPRPPHCPESSIGAVCQQMSRLGPLEDTFQPLSTSSSSFCALTPPHPLHSSSLPPLSSHPSLLSSSLPAPSSSPSSSLFVGPCETDESQGFSQYYASSHLSAPTENQNRSPKQATGTHSRSVSLSPRDQCKNSSEPTGSQFSQPSVPTEDQYNFPLQPSSSSNSDRLGFSSRAPSAGQICTGALRRSPTEQPVTHSDCHHGVALKLDHRVGTTAAATAENGTLLPPGAQTAGRNITASPSPSGSLRSSSPDASGWYKT